VNYLLDTCVISELVKKSPDKNVLNWLKSTPSENLYLSVITVGEIRKGLSKLPESGRKDSLTKWLNALIEDYKNRILTIDLTVAENWGNLQGKAEKEGNPMPVIDGLIAAIAYTHNLVLVTRNVSDFEPGGIPVKNPWIEGIN
jgi:predicted nucleic acid-binding protein